jgi:hypothetical protein
MKRVPRKSKKKIPKGYYCYTFTGEESKVWNEEYKTWVTAFHTKVCPFYENGDDGLFGNCRLLKCDVLDQVKSCSIKLDY